jgi:hypothetical protein
LLQMGDRGIGHQDAFVGKSGWAGLSHERSSCD